MKMFAEERQQQIVERLRAQGKVTVEELAAAFGVSAPTVRADLAALERRNLLRRAHGGALPRETSLYEPPFSERESAMAQEKRRIGRAAAARVQPGETVLIDAGTTAFEAARALIESGKRGLTVVTNNLPAALLLMDAPGIEVIVAGGTLSPRRQALLGPLTVSFLESLQADRLILGVNGVDAAGLTSIDFDAAAVKRAMIAHARETTVVADRTKIGQRAFAVFAPLSAAHLLLTDAGIDWSAERALREAGLGALERV